MIDKRTIWRYFLAFAGWTLLGLFFASRYIFYAATEPNAPAWWRLMLLPLVNWYLWGVLTPLILFAARRLSITRERRGSHLAIHLTLGVAFAVVQALLYSVAVWFLQQSAAESYSLSRTIISVLVNHIPFGIVTYAVIVAANYGIEYYRRYHESELNASRLQAMLAEAQLQSLKMQLHPHFLFNTLHSISALVHKDPEAADEMIARLSDLLRFSLDHTDKQEITLREEIAFLDAYLSIEKMRFENRLSLDFRVDSDALDAVVPTFLLQPLVENALRHGIMPREAGGTIEICAAREDGTLHISVRDDGVGLPNQNGEFQERIGLSNTRARLAHLYGASSEFDLSSAPGKGVTVKIALPFRHAIETSVKKANAVQI